MTTTFKRVDPELRELLEVLPALALDDAIVRRLRDSPRLVAPTDDDPGDSVTSTIQFIPSRADAPEISIHVHRYRTAATQPCLLHMHGGGFVMGTAEASAATLRRLCADLECTIVSVDYRLAPETRAPGQIEDCYAAFEWVYAQAEMLGIDPANIGLIGESAGGGLAAALALMIRDRANYTITALNMMYPMLDDRSCERSDQAETFIWTPHNNRYGWTALLGHPPGVDDVSPYAAPGREISLAGLPPTYIGVGDLDLFLDENLRFATMLAKSGVPVALNVYDGAYHGFDLVQRAAVSRRARQDRTEALKRQLYRASADAPSAIEVAEIPQREQSASQQS